MSYRKYLYFVEDIRFRKYLMVLVSVFVLLSFILIMSGLFAKDECERIAYDLNDTSFILSKCIDDLSVSSSALESCNVARAELRLNLTGTREDFIMCKKTLDTYDLTGKVPDFSGNIGIDDISRWTVFGSAKLWMLLVLIPVMFIFQILRVMLQIKLKGKKKNLLWLDVLWIIALIIYLAGVVF